jgi:hypothetical protein
MESGSSSSRNLMRAGAHAPNSFTQPLRKT